MKSLRIVMFALVLASAALSAAKPPFWRAFVALYNIQPDSVIGKTRCLNCHNPPGPPKRNVYGNAVEAALQAANTRMVTADILKSIEHKDAGDKVPFINKIKADIPPADPKKPKPQKGAPGHKVPMALLFKGPFNVVLFAMCLVPVASFARRQRRTAA